MRKIKRSNLFDRDFKRELKGHHRKVLENDLPWILEALASDTPLPIRFRDHALSNNYAGCRDCHIKPDLVLIYSKEDPEKLILLRLGSHSEVFR